MHVLNKQQLEPMGDTEFVAAFHHIALPIARQFEPDMVKESGTHFYNRFFY